MRKADLAVHILKEFRGELVGSIGKCLMSRGSLTLAQLENTTKLPQEKVKKALLVLIQYGMVDYKQNSRGLIEYKIYVDRVIYRLYYQKEVLCAGLLYGDAAEIMVEELLQEGRVPLDTLVETVTNKLNDAIKAQGVDLQDVQPSYVQDKFERLVATHFIKRCSVPVKDNRGKVVSLELLPAKVLFVVPPKSKVRAVKVKQEPTTGEPPAKKARQTPGTSHQDDSDNTPTVYWEVNHQRFLHHFRDQMLISAVESALDSEKPAEIMRTILRHCEKTTESNAETTVPMSFNEIHSQMPKDKVMTRLTLEQWLKLMTDSMPEFISKVGESGGGMYTVNTFRALKALCTAHIESVVEERFGTKARRLFRLTIQKKHMEQNKIEGCVLMSDKLSRELVCRLFEEQFVHVTELTRTPDYNPGRAFYLFDVDINQIAHKLLETSYQSLQNVLLTRQNMLSDAKRLLEKQERVEAIIISLGLPASYMHGEEGDGEELQVDEEKKEQVDAIMETITPAEQQQLKKVKALTQHLELREQNLVDSTIFLLETYLPFTMKTPIPKPAKNLLG